MSDERDTRQEEAGITFLELAQLRTEIRNEAIEECAREAEKMQFHVATVIAGRLRALKGNGFKQ